MAMPPVDQPTTEHLFLRASQEHQTGTAPTTPPASHATDAKTSWPLPDDGNAIVDRLTQWHRFSVWAIQIDPPADADPADALQDALIDLLGQHCQAHQGLWFAWRHECYGCVLPDMDATDSLILARRFQSDLASRAIDTVSIGIAEFPFLAFSRCQILINALKALDHAAFFGRNSCVAFDSVSLNISGDHFYQAHDTQNAIYEYQTALQLDPNNLNARNSLGVCLAETSQIAAARSEFETVLALVQQDAMALFNLGQLRLLQNESHSALVFFLRANDAAPHTFDIAFQIGKLLTEQQQWRQALPYLETARQLRTDWGATYCLQGQCLSALDQTQEAITAFKKAVKLNPNDATALSQLGTLFAEQGENLEICLTFCRQSVLITPQNGLFHFRLATLLHQGAKLLEALSEFEQAAALGHTAEYPIEEIRARLQASTATTDDDHTGPCALTRINSHPDDGRLSCPDVPALPTHRPT